MIGIDWGTTNLRAWRFGAAGMVVESREAPYGVTRLPPGGFDAAFAEVVGEWLADGETGVLIAGMAGSRQGWLEVPYLECPAGVEQIAGATRLLPIAPAAVRIIPGLRTRDADGVPEVLRGEETALIALLARRDAHEATICLPGTHTKWAHVGGDRVLGFTTAMTGEVFEALSQHTILRQSCAPPSADPVPPPGFMAGVAQAKRPGGLLHQAFGLRARWLMGEMAQGEGTGFLSGLLIGHDVAAALESGVSPPIILCGADALVRLYAAALEAFGIPHEVATGEPVAEGLVLVGRRLGLVG
ncbi:2-dehydro-3-deoxygalactonokinase [Plastoroseomonas arctica]|uniref:2-dehydro-3-deoxygalactonokinase n=1 Tax=Plastoroseomonas arctica TaxID=1509237 RepID=A0AAF1K5K7_9PROT|nr:2-dehydro-3-deoxygalactonokinase [Plastoroseomonas arctica]MBR0656675.1 2-dehydro-3-deoxygalactonokinase [Plastoroseomonas arctica]